VNFDNFIVTRNDCKTTDKLACLQKDTFNPVESTTAIELNKVKTKTTLVPVNSPKTGIQTMGVEYTDKVCLSETSAGCIPV
jgi:hypothetical protein